MLQLQHHHPHSHAEASSPRRHPRRHHRRQKPSSASRKRGDMGISVSPDRQALNDSNESGEPAGASARKWFDQSNNNPEMDASLHFQDSEPPYFLPHNSSSSSNGNLNDVQHRISQHVMLQAATNGSSADEYRSVIDDLTIENKKLKEKLRKYEKLNPPHLEKDKLFEVKIHSLPSRKRKELEETLRAFASSLDESTSCDALQKISIPSLTPNSLSGGQLGHKNAPSSSTSNSRPVDSAYASMSNSGPTPSLALGLEGKLPTQSRGGKEEIQNFLHNIPQGLVPKHSSVMTKRQKKKLVVRRLEQLFTGKEAVMNDEHSQPLQQQEVSRSAARADRAADGKSTFLEGPRESNMLPQAMHADTVRSGKLPEEQSREAMMSRNALDSSDESSPDRLIPEQRPTRPLDLDPDRAQIPADNVRYIRHLGLSTPRLASDESADSATDAEGWTYLNLLINMAQLHIINVTPDFVRSAISDVSQKFQISRDGKKLRWKGGNRGTQISSDGDTPSLRQPENDSIYADAGGRKRRKIQSGRFKSAPVNVQDPAVPAARSTFSNAFHYKPLFHHHQQSFSSSSEATSSDESTSLSEHNSRYGTGLLSGRNRSTVYRSAIRGKKCHDEGPIVFYNNAKFCTDLSGDRECVSVSRNFPGIDYRTRPTPLGIEKDATPKFSRTNSGSLFPFRPFRNCSKGPSFLDVDGPKTPEPLGSSSSSDFFIDSSPASRIQSSTTQRLQKFEASGLGGIKPADHFAIRVETLRTVPASSSAGTPLSNVSTPGLKAKKFRHSIAKESLKLFHQERSADAHLTGRLAAVGNLSPTSPAAPKDEVSELPIKFEIVNIQGQNLPPSELPPPLGYYTTHSTSSDEDGDDHDSEDEEDEDESKIRDFVRSSRLCFEHPKPENDEEDDEYESMLDDDDEEDDSSIDMLAQVRAEDPELAWRREREEDVGMKEVMGQIPLVRSSVATGGVDSGMAEGSGSSVESEGDGEEDGNEYMSDED